MGSLVEELRRREAGCPGRGGAASRPDRGACGGPGQEGRAGHAAGDHPGGSLIASALSPSSSSRYISPTRDESASRYLRSPVFYVIAGRNTPGSRWRSGKDVASVATASSPTRPSLVFNRDHAPWYSRRENPRRRADHGTDTAPSAGTSCSE